MRVRPGGRVIANGLEKDRTYPRASSTPAERNADGPSSTADRGPRFASSIVPIPSGTLHDPPRKIPGEARLDHSPFQLGVRFSANAVAPSIASFDVKTFCRMAC